jgi:hypothetical protein
MNMARYDPESVAASSDYHKEHHFKTHQVKVKLKKQHDQRQVKVQAESVLPPTQVEQDDFHVGRHVLNLVLEKDEQARIDPPAEIWVALTGEDHQRAGGREKVKMAYWDGAQWVVFQKGKHKYRLVDVDQDGTQDYAVAEIAQWGDPPIAVGH